MQALAVRLGFVEEGKAREALFKQGQWNDIIYYGLLETDFKKDSARRLS